MARTRTATGAGVAVAALAASLLTVAAAPAAVAGEACNGRRVIAHRGASQHRPENTLAAFRAADRRGADWIELDLVATRDRHLVARHEPWLSPTTDVEDRGKFVRRRATRVVNGRRITDWFADDLTLRQVRKLHTEERDPRLRRTSATYADKRHIRVPTLHRVVRLAERRGLGLLVETKQEDYLASRGIDLAGMLIAYLKRHRPSVQVWMHSFDSATARRLARELPYPVAQLVTKDSQVKRAGQRKIARYADAIAAPRTLVGRRRTSRAHRLGLQMFTWTFADDRDAHPKRRYRNACRDRIDGVITDSPRTAVRMVG
ncbi:MAG: hypothetical protein M3467_03255 [Actinomycetota bacterium]|nr:hypothetical protein [Actinomycetota bacterium]